ncbi:hypothetical protein [Salsipaludibacter albus]|uniref:hypothetical protein n=1 Tax=Salsipaludibacter albus TaxID=2849650 RepID=UPI001EE41F0E|nr:hypothetical protein [Salsipaludibacter albus]MBY5164225.1 hypothetical protein [Salsipaludibacter albus]
MATDRDADLSAGVVVETDLVARLFGLRLLRLSGTVLLLPARTVDDVEVAVRPTRGDARRSGAVDPPGTRLAAVARRLDDNASRLARAATGPGADAGS